MRLRTLLPGLLVCRLAYPGDAPQLRWSFGPVMPMAKTCRATAVAGEDVITVGGTWWETTAPGKKIKRWASTVYLLDTRRMEWKTLPAYPLEAGYDFAAAIGRKVYVTGGRGTERGNAETFVLDLGQTQLKWVAGPPLPRPRWGQVGGIVNGVIYIAGGREGDPSSDEKNAPADSVLALDPQTVDASWKKVATLPRPKVEWQMTTGCAGKLYFFGGLITAPNDADKGLLPQAEAFALDVSNGRWNELRPLPLPMGSGAVVALDSTSILLGGGFALAVPAAATPDRKARTYFTGECLLYDTVRNEYRKLAPLRMAVTDQGLVYARHKVFAIGGEDAPYQTRTDAVQIGELF